MKLGVSTACFYGKEHIENTFAVLNQMGVDVTEVFLNTFSEYEKPFVDALVERKNGIKVHSIHAHGTCFEPELFSCYDRIRDDAEMTFRKVCSAGYALGAKYYTFHGPFAKVDRPLNIDIPKFTERLNQLCDIAESYGIQIAYENVCWAYCTTPDFFKMLKEHCPKLKATLDVKQAIYSGIEPLKFLDAMEDRLVTVHICDMDAKNNPALPLEGRYNFERLLKELATRTTDVTVLLEVYGNCYRDYNHLAQNYARLNAIVNKLLGI